MSKSTSFYILTSWLPSNCEFFSRVFRGCFFRLCCFFVFFSFCVLFPFVFSHLFIHSFIWWTWTWPSGSSNEDTAELWKRWHCCENGEMMETNFTTNWNSTRVWLFLTDQTSKPQERTTLHFCYAEEPRSSSFMTKPRLKTDLQVCDVLKNDVFYLMFSRWRFDP